METNLWDRQPWETDKSFDAFTLFLSMHPKDRSVAAAYRELKRQEWEKEQVIQEEIETRLDSLKKKQVPGYFRGWADTRDRDGRHVSPQAKTWGERAAAYDSHLAKLERAAWEEKFLELKQKEWDLSQKLLDKAEKMLLMPLAKEEAKGGKVIITPANWSMGDAPRVAEMGSRLGRRAAEVAIEKTGQEIEGQITVSTGLEELEADELDELITRLEETRRRAIRQPSFGMESEGKAEEDRADSGRDRP